MVDVLIALILEILGLTHHIKNDSGNQRSVLYKVEKRQPKRHGVDYLRDRRKVQNIKFQVYMLAYAFYEDDNSLDFSEMNEIKKHFKEAKFLMESEDIKEIKKTIRRPVSLEKLVDFKRINKLDEFDIKKAINLISIVSGRDRRYKDIIKHIERRFFQEFNY